MMIYFNTVRRKRPVKQGGELIQVDWSGKKITKRIPLYPTDPDIDYDPNPRGNSRGGKGIIINDREIFVGTYHTILVFDHQLNLKRRITNPLFSNLHEMCFNGENIWVSCSAIDCAVQINRDGGTVSSWWPREDRLLQEKYGLWPMDIDKTADNRLKFLHLEVEKKESHTHLNSVVKYGDRTYVLLNRQGAVVQVEPTVKVIIEDQALRGGHSPAISVDGKRMILCSSFTKNILFYDLESGDLQKKIHLLDFDVIVRLHEQNPDQPFNKSIFVRGLDIVDSRRILVGISPASILEIDIHNHRLLDFYQYSSDVGDAVHGLVHLPTYDKNLY